MSARTSSPCGTPRAALALAGLLAGLQVSVPADAAPPRAFTDPALARWTGAPRELLIASWGKPAIEEAAADGVVLIYMGPHDLANMGQGRHDAVVAAPSAPAAAQASCTTRFLLRNDQVVSASAAGEGCIVRR